MKTKKSAILQMLNHERGSFEIIPKSEEYLKALDEFCDKMDKFVKELEKYPELAAQFKEAEKAADIEKLIYFDLVYKEAFAFGLAIGQEVFDE